MIIARSCPATCPKVVSVCFGAVKWIGAYRWCTEPGQSATVAPVPPGVSGISIARLTSCQRLVDRPLVSGGQAFGLARREAPNWKEQ